MLVEVRELDIIMEAMEIGAFLDVLGTDLCCDVGDPEPITFFLTVS